MSEGVNKGLMFFLMVLIARYLNVEGYGNFSFALSFTILFSILADLGLTTLTIRDVSKNKNLAKKYLDNISTIKLFLGFLSFGLIFILIKIMNKSQDIELLVYLFALYIIINSLNEFFRSIFRAFEQMQYDCLSKIIQGTIIFAFGFFFIINRYDVFLIAGSFVFGTLASFIITIILIIRRYTFFEFKLDFKEWKFFLNEGIILGLASLSVLLFSHIDKVMLGIMNSNLEVGYYSASYKILEIVIFLAVIFSQAIFPRLASLSRESEKAFAKFIRKIKYIYFVTPIFIISFILIFSNEIVNFLYGKTYQSSILILKWLSLTIIPVFLNNFYGNIFIVLNKQRIYLYGTLLGLLGNVVFNIILIPFYGAIGASIATFISEFIALLIFYFLFKRFFY